MVCTLVFSKYFGPDSWVYNAHQFINKQTAYKTMLKNRDEDL